jgi:hypothetical protein
MTGALRPSSLFYFLRLAAVLGGVHLKTRRRGRRQELNISLTMMEIASTPNCKTGVSQ